MQTDKIILFLFQDVKSLKILGLENTKVILSCRAPELWDISSQVLFFPSSVSKIVVATPRSLSRVAL